MVLNSIFLLDFQDGIYGTIGTDTNNLADDGTCGSATNGNPNLGPLANNGGPTPTHALLEGSDAIDTADAGICAASPVDGEDQRGVSRPQGGGCDIGAYEKDLSYLFLPLILKQ